MAKKTKQVERDRRAKIEEMRRTEAARQRRRSVLFLVVAVLAGLGLIAAVAVPSYLRKVNDPANRPVSDFGVSASTANCGDIQTSPGTNNDKDRQHVKMGTTVRYATVPPSYGPHWPQPAFPARAFYTVKDRPAMEELVHNLEHGYTVLWYDRTVKGKDLHALKDISDSARTKDQTSPGNKFIVSAWFEAYGKLPAGKHIAMAHWGAQSSDRLLCGRPSGEVVSRFITKYPASDAPEAAAS